MILELIQLSIQHTIDAMQKAYLMHKTSKQ